MNDVIPNQNAFSIQNISGCRIVFGSVPISEFTMLMHGFSKKALMDIGLANRIGAAFVIGEPEKIDALRKMDLPVSQQRLQEYQDAITSGAGDGENHCVAVWLRDGDRGKSSNAMCKRFFGVPQSAGNDHPHDPDDLSRCIAFLDHTQSHGRIYLMRDVSLQWSALVDAWTEIVDAYACEKANAKFSKTYKLMRDTINHAEP